MHPTCARPFTGFFERQEKPGVGVGFSALGLLFGREVGAAAVSSSISSFVFRAFEKIYI